MILLTLLAFETTPAGAGPVSLPGQRTVQLQLGPAWNPWAREAVAAWNDVYGADDLLTTWEWPSDPCDPADGLSTAGWSGPGCAALASPTTMAVTLSTYDTWTGELGETDLVFNPSFSWTNSVTEAARSGDAHFGSVARHELGHVQGLAHEDDIVAAMNTYYSLAEARLHADDHAGLRWLYGNGRSSFDLAADAWAPPAPGQAATPTPCDTIATTGAPVYESFSLENLGSEDAPAFDVAVVLSADPTWDAADRILSTGAGFSLAAGAHSRTDGAPRLPTDLPAGAWYIGLVVDPNDAWEEASEDNNVAWCPTPVTVRCADDDGDGHGGSACGGPDCDDADPGRHPGAAESCDGEDDDCDGLVDEDVQRTYFADQDGDGHGRGDARLACGPDAAFPAPLADDCDDRDPSVHPDAPDDPCDGFDADCDRAAEPACAPSEPPTPRGCDTAPQFAWLFAPLLAAVRRRNYTPRLDPPQATGALP